MNNVIDYSDKLEAAKEMLGDKYLLHPSNMVKKLRTKQTTFQKFYKKTQKKK